MKFHYLRFIWVSCFSILMLTSLCAQNEGKIIEHDTLKAKRYFERGKTMASNLQIEPSVDEFQKAISKFEKFGLSTLLVDAYNHLSYQLIELGEFDKARATLMHNLDLASMHLASDSLVGRTYQNLGYLFTELSKYDSAEVYLEKALENRVRNYGANSGEVDDIYYSFGRLYFFKDDFQEAERYANLVMSGTKEHAKNLLRRAQAFNLIAIIYYVKADYENAKIFFELGLEAFGENRSLKDQNTYFSTLENLGAMEYLTGNYERAYQYYSRTLRWRLKHFPENHTFTGSTYFNLAEVLDRRKEYDEAINLLEKSIDIYANAFGKQHESTTEAQATLGMVFFHQGDIEKALSTLKEALANTPVIDQEQSNSISLFEQLGDVYNSVEKYDSSIYFYNRSIKSLERKYGVRHPRVASVLIKKAELYRQIGNLELSLLESRKALNAISNPFPDDELSTGDVLFTTESIEVLESTATTLRMAFLEGIRGDEVLGQALAQIKLAIELILKKRMLIFDQKAQRQFSERYASVYNEAMRIVALLYQQTSDSNYLQDAFAIMEGSKYFAITHTGEDPSNRVDYHIPDSLIERERTLKVDISYYDQKIFDLEGSKDGYDTLLAKQLEDQLFDLKREFENLKFKLEREYPNYHGLQYNLQLSSLAETQMILDGNATLINFFWSDSTLYAMKISKQDIVFKETILDDEFLLDMENFQVGLAYSASKITPERFVVMANRIFQKLFGNLTLPNNGSEDKLIIIPDGLLNNLNFDLLVRNLPVGTYDWSDINYLIKDYAISFAYSVSSLINEESIPPRPRKDLLAFSFGDSQIGGNYLSMEAVRSADLNALPGSAKEIKAIADLVDGDYYYGQQASEQTFKEIAGDYQVLHLAVHGTVDEENPDYSKLHFNSKDTLEDGLLHVYELYNMEMNADLAVLSACNTGSGKYQTREGIMSLGHAFSYAGVNSLLLTRWELSDEAAPEIMRVFYRELKKGKSKSQALRIAKLAYLENASMFRANPFYWGSFFVMGDDNPIEFEDADRSYLLIGGVLLLVIAILAIRKRNRYPRNSAA